jgi:hypothetical protein
VEEVGAPVNYPEWHLDFSVRIREARQAVLRQLRPAERALLRRIQRRERTRERGELAELGYRDLGGEG